MKLLFIQLGRIGDMVLLTPLFKAVKEKFPDVEINVIASRRNYSVIQNNPHLNNIIVYEKTPLKFINTIREIRKTFYNYYIDPKDHYSRESRLFSKIVKAEKKIGFNGDEYKSFDISIPSDKENVDLHCTQRFFNSLKPLSISIELKIPNPELYTYKESDDYVQYYLHANNLQSVNLVNISATKSGRMFSSLKWIEILQNYDSFKNIVLLFAPTENNQAKVLKTALPFLNLFPSRSIHDVISIVKIAKAIITVDTALVHIASAFNLPIVCFFINNEEQIKKYYPLSDIAYVIKSSTPNSDIETISNNVIKNILNEFLK
ncbi:MAG: lipopolysaccharide heptosyltransferase family protein [Bacteroidetes bacterium]|nr:MAG: lipopolysaccharide heptosyltransferase family protein [Bacteroidota bacterium]